MNIDPALRAASGGQSTYGQSHRSPPRAYSDATAQQNFEPGSGRPSGQSQYYGMPPTPNSYPSGGAQSQDSPYTTSPAPLNPVDPNDPNDLKRSRACEACRQLKVKCEPDDSSPTGSCKRCAKAGRQCVVTAPSRKRQKKTDSRVAELEKKIDALQSQIEGRGSLNGQSVDPAVSAQMAELRQHQLQLNEGGRYSQDGAAATPLAGTKRKMDADPIEDLKKAYDSGGGATPSKQNPSPVVQSPMPQVPAFLAMWSEQGKKDGNDGSYVDIIEREILDEKTAYRVFDRYHKDMCQHLPIVVFPAGTTGAQIRRSKPILFLSIMAAAICPFRADLQPNLVGEVTRILADRIVYRGEKSLELVQAVQVLTVYYQPPEKYEELNFNQMIHLAAVMALDLGMGKRSRAPTTAIWREYMDKKAPLPDFAAADTRRAWLGCYYMCANAAMSLRRPLLLRWSAYNDECLEILATAPDAQPSDRWLCHLVRLQHIAEEVGLQFSMDDPASIVSLADTKTQYHLRAFERQLHEWNQQPPPNVAKSIVESISAIINLYMHEIAMHHNHNIDDFKPPYNIAPQDHANDELDFVTPAHIDSLTICTESIHLAFDSFLAMDTELIRQLPTIFFVRNSYAAVALIKMYSAVSAPASKFGTVFKPADLKVEYYLNGLIDKLTKASEGNQSRVAHKFSFIFNMLKSWYSRRMEVQLKKNGSQPPKNPIVSSTAAPGDIMNQQPQSMLGGSGTQPSGLQMLSDAAMGKNTPDASQSAAAAAGFATGNQYGGMPTPGIMTPNTMALSNYGYVDPFDPNFGFTPDELNAMSSLMDDPGWMSFPMEQGGGWAF